MTTPTPPGFTVSIFDNLYNKLGSLNTYVSCTVNRNWNGVGTGTIVVSEKNPLAGKLLACNLSVVPIRVQSATRVWTGRVGHASLAGPVGSGTVTATLVDDWAWFRAILAWPDPTQPLTSQPASSDTPNTPIDTAVKAYITANAKRLGLPMYVIPAPSPDPSPTVNLSARFTPIDQLVTVPLTTSNRTLTIYTWLPGDPQPSGTTLSAPTLVVDIIGSQDRPTLKWSDQFGGVTARTINVTAPTAISAVAGGAGALTSRYFTSVNNQAAFTNQGNFAFREVYVDASSQAISARVVQAAQDSLGTTNSGTASYNVTVLDGNPWTFGQDYALGDIGGASLAGVEVRQRITRVTETDDATNGYQVQPVLGASGTAESPNVAILRAIASLTAALNVQNASR